MQKFLSIPVTNQQNQLVACNDIKLIEQASTTTVTIAYGGGKVVTITHAADAAGSEIMRDAIQSGVVEILSEAWTLVSLQMDKLTKAVSNIAIA